MLSSFFSVSTCVGFLNLLQAPQAHPRKMAAACADYGRGGGYVATQRAQHSQLHKYFRSANLNQYVVEAPLQARSAVLYGHVGLAR